jgi:hypothetical protein
MRMRMVNQFAISGSILVHIHIHNGVTKPKTGNMIESSILVDIPETEKGKCCVSVICISSICCLTE